MQESTRTLAAIALWAALASPDAFAQTASAPATDKPAATTAVTSTTASAASATPSVASTTASAASATPSVASATGSAASATPSVASATASPAAGDNPGNGDWWAEADRDGDGKLSVAEATANPSIGTRFAMIDTDRDGFVTQDEYRVYFTANVSQGEGGSVSHSAVLTRDLWLALDTDSDSRISLAEATGDAALRSAFSAIDANADGFVVQDEYTLYAQAHR